MENESNIDIKNIIRMKEIANIYKLTGQEEKSIKYHENIIELSNKSLQIEEILYFKINSLNQFKLSYKSLETIKTLLNKNPKDIIGLFEIATYLTR